MNTKEFDYPYFGQHPWYAILLQDKFLAMLFEDGGNPNLFCESGCLFDDIDPSSSAKKQMPIRVSAFFICRNRVPICFNTSARLPWAGRY